MTVMIDQPPMFTSRLHHGHVMLEGRNRGVRTPKGSLTATIDVKEMPVLVDSGESLRKRFCPIKFGENHKTPGDVKIAVIPAFPDGGEPFRKVAAIFIN